MPRPTAVWLWRATTGLVPLEFFAAIARGGWLLAVFVASLWMLGRQGLRDWWALPAAVLMLMAVHVATLSSHRFAVPILPVVFVLVSGPLRAAVRAAPALRDATPSTARARGSRALDRGHAVSGVAARDCRDRPSISTGQSADNVVDPVSQTRGARWPTRGAASGPSCC